MYKKIIMILMIVLYTININIYSENDSKFIYEGIWGEMPVEGDKSIKKYLIIERLSNGDFFIIHIDLESSTNNFKCIGKFNKDMKIAIENDLGDDFIVSESKNINYSETISFFWMEYPASISEQFVRLQKIDIGKLLGFFEIRF